MPQWVILFKNLSETEAAFCNFLASCILFRLYVGVLVQAYWNVEERCSVIHLARLEKQGLAFKPHLQQQAKQTERV